MRPCQFILTIALLCWTSGANAQEPEALSTLPDQWQLTVDVIKSKAQDLVLQNNGLQDKYHQLKAEVQNLKQSIAYQQYKNGQLEQFLKSRHGQTDQELLIVQLQQDLRAKRDQTRNLEDQAVDLTSKQQNIDSSNKQLNAMIAGVELRLQQERQKAQPVVKVQLPKLDDQLDQLRKQLEDENRQEVLLGNQLEELKSSSKTQTSNADSLNMQNKELEARLNFLRLKKLQMEEKSLSAPAAVVVQSNTLVYDQLKKRKYQLEASISSYEARMDELKESTLQALSWSVKKKKLVHEMVQVDARNNKVRYQIKVLQEDIEILRDQVSRLERRLDFAQGRDPR